MSYRPIVAALCVGLVCLLVGAGATEAATESVVTLKIEFSGTSCPVSTVVVSGASCSSSDIANELTTELTAEGISGAFCGYSANDMWECAYLVPTGCTQDDIALTLQHGDNCTVVPQAWVSKQLGSFGVYAFNVE